MDPDSGSRTQQLGAVLCRIYVVAIAIPLFVFPSYAATNLNLIFRPNGALAADPQALRVHWVVGFAGLVGAYFVARSFTKPRLVIPPRSGLIAGFVAVLAVSLLVGLLDQPSWLSVVYFVQTTIPLVGFFVGAYLAVDVAAIRRTFGLLVASTTGAVVLLLILGFAYDVPGKADGIVKMATAIPQFRNYYPFIVAGSLALALALFRSMPRNKLRSLVLAAVAVHALFYLLVASRTALVMLFVVALTPVLFALGSRTSRPAKSTVIASIAVLAAVAILSTQYGPMVRRWRSSGFEGSNYERIEYAAHAARVIGESPLVGRMFIADWREDPIGGFDYRIPRMIRAHNQYLDIGVRAGIPAMIALGLIMVAVGVDLRRSWASGRSQPDVRPLVIGLSGALIAVTIGNLTQLFLVQAQTGSLAWLLAGTTVKLRTLLGERPPPEPR